MSGFWQRLSGVLDGSAAAGEQSPESRLQMAAALLLVEVARADYEDDPAEFEAVAAAVREHFGLAADAAEELLAAARDERESAISFEQHIRVINEHFDADQKRDLLRALWQVAYADGELHRYEEHLMRRICELLFLAHSDFIQAKLAVTGELETD